MATGSREERIPNGVNVAHLIGREITCNQKSGRPHDDDRESLRPGRGAIGPAWRDIRATHHSFHAHARHHGNENGERNHKRADERVVRIGGRARGPEHQGREEQPQPDERVGPLRPVRATRQGEQAEQDDKDPGADVADAESPIAPVRRG